MSALGERGREYPGLRAENFHGGVKCGLSRSGGISEKSSFTRAGRSFSRSRSGDGISGSEVRLLRGTTTDSLRPLPERERASAQSMYASRASLERAFLSPKTFRDESERSMIFGCESGTTPSFMSAITACGFCDQNASIQSESFTARPPEENVSAASLSEKISMQSEAEKRFSGQSSSSARTSEKTANAALSLSGAEPDEKYAPAILETIPPTRRAPPPPSGESPSAISETSRKMSAAVPAASAGAGGNARRRARKSSAARKSAGIAEEATPSMSSKKRSRLPAEKYFLEK